MLQQGDRDQLQLLLKEKEIELEHKLNTLIALNEKLNVFNDLKNDVAENQAIFKQSENEREKLQITITTNAQKLKEDSEMHEKFEQQLQEKIQSLMEEVQELEREMASLQQAHLEELNRQDEQHNDQINRRHQEMAQMREQDIKREQDWIAEASRVAQDNDTKLKNQATQYANLDKWYRDELEAEKQRNRRELAELRDMHARELAKRDQNFQQQEDRFLA